jgi:peroxiredoxin
MTTERALSVGDDAPSFTEALVAPDRETEDVPITDFLVEKSVLLCFYTNDFSPDCVGQWCSFRDYDWFTANDDVHVVGVSKSRPFTHRKFIDYLDLGFPLYADTNLDIASAFGVDYRVFGVARRARRSCFLIDQSGDVQYRWLGDHSIDPTRDSPPVDEIRVAIEDHLGDDRSEPFAP